MGCGPKSSFSAKFCFAPVGYVRSSGPGFLTFGSLASLSIVVVNVDELKPKRTAAASRGFLAVARLSCYRLLKSDNEVDSRTNMQWLRKVTISSCFCLVYSS